MKAELTLPLELVDAIADRVIDKLRPLLSGNGRDREEDVIFDVPEVADYLKVSTKWIYERTHLKEIPHIKVDGVLRFRKRDIDKWLNTHNVPAVRMPAKILMKAVK